MTKTSTALRDKLSRSSGHSRVAETQRDAAPYGPAWAGSVATTAVRVRFHTFMSWIDFAR